MSEFTIVQVSPLSPSSYCFYCGRLFKPGDQYRLVARDLTRPGWSKYNRKLQADTSVMLKACAVCPPKEER